MHHSQLDIVFHYLRYTCLHYEATKPNKKKIKQLVEAIPYFLPEKYQNLFFDVVRTYPIDCYWDSAETMQDYGYNLYSEFHKRIKQTFQSRVDYDQEVYTHNPISSFRKQIRSLLFFLVVGGLLYLLYLLR